MDESQLEKLTSGDEMKKFTDYFEYIDTIGQGAFGQVVKAINLTTRQEVAIKIIKKKLVNRYDQLKQESSILASLKHQNIVRFIEVKETDSRILIVMELIEGGSLESLMEKRKSKQQWFTEEECKTIIKSILQALSYIHENNVVHRDLKPENILISDDLSCVKLSDFGLSSVHTYLMTKQCGTLIYMAPELLHNKIYNKSVDIWGVGVIMYILLKGQHPYYKKGDGLEQILENTLKMHQDTYLTQQAKCLYMSLFKKLTELDAGKRYTAEQGLQHPWLNELEAEVPKTMEELLQAWIQAQKMFTFIQTLMLLSKIGYHKKIEDRDIYDKFSHLKLQEIQLKNKREGKIATNKEFYDQLFQEYQNTLTQQQLDNLNIQKEQKIIEDKTSSLATVQAKLQFIIKTRRPSLSHKIIEQPQIIEQTEELKINESQPDITNNDIQLEHQNSEKSELNISMSISPTKSLKKKRRSPTKPSVRIVIPNQMNTSQQLINQKPTTQSQVSSPTKIVSATNNSLSIKYQIKLKPLQTQEKELPPPILNASSIAPTEPYNFKTAIRNPRQSYINRLSRLSVDRDQVQPAILDLSSMALGGFSPVHSNQFLFPTKMPSNPIHVPQKRVYQNEFHPSKVLTSVGSKKFNEHYNFINGGPK